MNQELSLEEMKDPLLGKAITGGRREALTGEMNIAGRNGPTIGPTTITKMILGGKDITPTKAKITGGKMDTPTEEVPEDLLTMIGMNIPEA